MENQMLEETWDLSRSSTILLHVPRLLLQEPLVRVLLAQRALDRTLARCQEIRAVLRSFKQQIMIVKEFLKFPRKNKDKVRVSRIQHLWDIIQRKVVRTAITSLEFLLRKIPLKATMLASRARWLSRRKTKLFYHQGPKEISQDRF